MTLRTREIHYILNGIQSSRNILWSDCGGVYCTHPRGATQTLVVACRLGGGFQKTRSERTRGHPEAACPGMQK